MPVIVIGADTPLGQTIITNLVARHSEIRAFVSDPSTAPRYREQGVKVAIGDISDGSHVGGAASGCFSAIVIPEAAFDSRERSFSHSPEATVATWAAALAAASITRLIWIEDSRLTGAIEEFRTSISQVLSVAIDKRDQSQIAAEVARLDDLESIDDV